MARPKKSATAAKTEAPKPVEDAAGAASCCEEITDEQIACCRHKNRTPEERRALIIRLNRIEGQVRGIRRMIENDVYCPDVLIQVAAARAATDAFSRALLDTHIRTCVKNDLIEGHDETVDELLHVLHKLI